MASEVQSIGISSHEVKKDPAGKQYVAYNVQVTTPTRTWTVQRRYNDFVSLNDELKASVGKAPPGELPGKHPWRIGKRVDDEALTTERRVGLESYLRAILNTKDPRWRMAYTFTDFISLSQNAPSSSHLSTGSKLASYLPSSQSPSDAQTRFTSTSWLTEHGTVQAHLRTIRASLLKRDTLAQLGESSQSRSASVEAKRLIKDTRGRIDALEKGLPRVDGLGTGERARRDGMVGTLRDELANLERMAEAGVRVTVQPQQSSDGPARAGSPANDASRAALLGSAAVPQRVFGAAAASTPQETAETRPLDDRGLLQLQKQQMDNQDEQLQGLSAILRRQMRLGQDIGKEIGEQNEMLDELSGEVDRVGGKLGRAKREMNKWVVNGHQRDSPLTTGLLRLHK